MPIADMKRMQLMMTFVGWQEEDLASGAPILVRISITDER